MPIYDYRCSDCGRVWEVLKLSAIEEPPRCPSCNSERTAKMPSAPFVLSSTPAHGSTCCGREERCDTPPCSGGSDGCHRG